MGIIVDGRFGGKIGLRVCLFGNPTCTFSMTRMRLYVK